MASKKRIARSPHGRAQSDIVKQIEEQPARVVAVLLRWCEVAPGRGFRVEHTADGWTARLDERRSSRGSTAVDALAQIAVVASFELNGGAS